MGQDSRTEAKVQEPYRKTKALMLIQPGRLPMELIKEVMHSTELCPNAPSIHM